MPPGLQGSHTRILPRPPYVGRRSRSGPLPTNPAGLLPAQEVPDLVPESAAPRPPPRSRPGGPRRRLDQDGGPGEARHSRRPGGGRLGRTHGGRSATGGGRLPGRCCQRPWSRYQRQQPELRSSTNDTPRPPGTWQGPRLAEEMGGQSSRLNELPAAEASLPNIEDRRCRGKNRYLNGEVDNDSSVPRKRGFDLTLITKAA